MRTPTDVLRSVQRYAALILPAPWDVRLMGEAANPVRPFARVSQNGTAQPVGRFGAHSVRMQGAYTVHAYMAEGDSREAAEVAAQGVEEGFWTAIKLKGIAVAPARPAGGGLIDNAAHGDVVPLWDFVNDGTGMVDPPRSYCDFADVVDFQTRPIPDPANPRLMTVVCDLRLQWWRSGSVVAPGSQPLDAIRVTGRSVST